MSFRNRVASRVRLDFYAPRTDIHITMTQSRIFAIPHLAPSGVSVISETPSLARRTRNDDKGVDTAIGRIISLIHDVSSRQTMVRLIQLLLLVRLDGAIGHGVGDAGEHKAVLHLLVVEEGLVGLVNLASLKMRNTNA